MTKRKINAWEAWRDIMRGMSDEALMTKYKLSQDELGHLYQVLVQEGLLERVDDGYVAPPKKQIVIEEFVEDVRSGMSDSNLMDRYELTAPLLTATLRQLLEQKFLDQEDLDSREPSPLSRVSLFSVRQVPRYSSPLTMTISGEKNLEKKGRVLVISVKGLRTVGLEAKVGQTQTLTIHGDEFGEIGTFWVRGTCRWTKAGERGEVLAGFEIVDIPTGSRQELLHWIRMCTI